MSKSVGWASVAFPSVVVLGPSLVWAPVPGCPSFSAGCLYYSTARPCPSLPVLPRPRPRPRRCPSSLPVVWSFVVLAPVVLALPVVRLASRRLVTRGCPSLPVAARRCPSLPVAARHCSSSSESRRRSNDASRRPHLNSTRTSRHHDLGSEFPIFSPTLPLSQAFDFLQQSTSLNLPLNHFLCAVSIASEAIPFDAVPSSIAMADRIHSLVSGRANSTVAFADCGIRSINATQRYRSSSLRFHFVATKTRTSSMIVSQW